jgi:hypothetical protein
VTTTDVRRVVRAYRAKQLVRAVAASVGAVPLALLAAVFVGAAIDENDADLWWIGTVLAVGAAAFLVGAVRLLRRRARPPSAARALAGHVLQRATIGAVGVLAGATMTVAALATASSVDVAALGGAAVGVALAVLGGYVAVASARRAGALRRLAETGRRRIRVVAVGHDERITSIRPPVIVIEPQDGPVDGSVAVPVMFPQYVRTAVAPGDWLDLHGDPRAGALVVLRDPTGEPLWPAARARPVATYDG